MSDYIRNEVTDIFGKGQLYCAETTLKLIAEAGGRDAKPFIPLATGFCTGAARTCGQCGAVSGAIMGIGLYAGRSEMGGDLEDCYSLVQDFLARFEEKCGSINCFGLIKCDFGTKEGQDRFKKHELIKDCIEYVIYAVEIALELLRESGLLSENEELIASQVAPCGLSCGKCLAFEGGAVQVHALGLKDALGENFGVYARRFAGMNSIFENYGQFEVLLEFMAKGSCGGCRESGCLFKDCKVPECVRRHGVTFCYQCEDFPCNVHGMPEALAERWKTNNEKMKEVGDDAWYRGCLERPRYP